MSVWGVTQLSVYVKDKEMVFGCIAMIQRSFPVWISLACLSSCCSWCYHCFPNSLIYPLRYTELP